MLLNPDFKSQTQWRFVNRAIDEVSCCQAWAYESDPGQFPTYFSMCPTVELLVCKYPSERNIKSEPFAQLLAVISIICTLFIS